MSRASKSQPLSLKARELLTALKRRDVDYTTVDLAAYEELRDAGLATVIFGRTGIWVFATARGKAA